MPTISSHSHWQVHYRPARVINPSLPSILRLISPSLTMRTDARNLPDDLTSPCKLHRHCHKCSRCWDSSDNPYFVLLSILEVQTLLEVWQVLLLLAASPTSAATYRQADPAIPNITLSDVAVCATTSNPREEEKTGIWFFNWFWVKLDLKEA